MNGVRTQESDRWGPGNDYRELRLWTLPVLYVGESSLVITTTSHPYFRSRGGKFRRDVPQDVGRVSWTTPGREEKASLLELSCEKRQRNGAREGVRRS